MIGEAQALALDVPLPEGFALRRVTTEVPRFVHAQSDEVGYQLCCSSAVGTSAP
jgi:hypothetical protein